MASSLWVADEFLSGCLVEREGAARRRLLRVIGVLATFCAVRQSFAQQPRRLTAPREYSLDQWTTVEGLPQNSVNAIARTPDGYLWVGTFGGLARFDGLRFTVVDRVDQKGHHLDRVLSLAVAPDSSLWVGTENGLLQYRAGRFREFGTADGLADRQITALYFDRSGSLWVGTEHGGAARYDGRRFSPVRAANGVPFNGVMSFVEDRAGTLWINARGHYVTLEREDAGGAEPRRLSKYAFDVLSLEDRDGSKWFRVTEGVGHVRQSAVDVFRPGFGPEVMIAQQQSGRYWWGTFRHGVVEFDDDGVGSTHAYPLADGTTDYWSRALLDGRDGNVWAGTTSNGLLRLKRNLFTTYRTANGLSHDIVTALMEARDGSLWAGTNCGGVNVIDPDRKSVRTYLGGRPGPGNDPCVFSLAQDSAGVVWVGTYGGGLTRIADGRVTRVGGLGVLRDSVILALFTDRGGTLWVGTNAAGLAQVVGGKVLRVYTTADGLASNSIRTIAQTRDGAIWVGTLEGLSRLDANGHLASYRAGNGLTSGYVRALYEDVDGTLWVGTYGGGLNRLRGGKFSHVTVADGLPDNVVSSILDDGRGNLWMSGNRGIYRVAKEQLNRLADGELRHVHSVLYGAGDGLINAETNGGFEPAAWRDRSGRLWFPTIKGLTTVDPTEAAGGAEPPSVALEEVVVDGQTYPPTSAIRIGPGRPNIEFRYTAASLSAPDNVTFRYRLERLDDRWTEPGARRVAYYSRLPAGNYRFVVAAANRDGVWNSAATSIDVVVLSPLYRRAWFITAVLGAILIASWTAHRTVLSARSDAIRDERSRLAREIHDSLLQGFGGIALQLHAASARLALSTEQQPLLDRVQTMIDNTLKQARQAVWDIRPAQAVGTDLLRECEDAGRRILGASVTKLRVTSHGRERRLSAQSRMECLRVVEEALTNVRKHADATHAVVDLRYGWRTVRITISDDGKGFHAERERQRPGHWGWLGMRERASRIGARLSVRSIVGAGTIVTLRAPYRAGIFTRLRHPG